MRVYHAARWRFQRERLSGKAFERCGGRSRIDNLLALEQRSVSICSVQWLNLIPARDLAMNRHSFAQNADEWAPEPRKTPAPLRSRALTDARPVRHSHRPASQSAGRVCKSQPTIFKCSAPFLRALVYLSAPVYSAEWSRLGYLIRHMDVNLVGYDASSVAFAARDSVQLRAGAGHPFVAQSTVNHARTHRTARLQAAATSTVTVLEVTVVPFTVKVATTFSFTGAAVGDRVPTVNGWPPGPGVPRVIPVSTVDVPCTVKVQVTDPLMSFPPWSFANNTNVFPVWVLLVDGDTAMEVTLPGTTVRVVVPEMVGSIVDVAVIVAEPTPTAVASPELESMLATVVGALDHVTEVLPELPSSKVPTAENCFVLFGAMSVMVWFAGVMPTAVSFDFGKNPRQLAPKATATRAVKASVNASLRPVNIIDRLR